MDLIDNLRRVPLFRHLSPLHLQLLTTICDEKHVEPGTILCRQAALGGTFFVIDSGEAILHRVDERGLQRPLGMVRGGEAFGATSLFLGEPRDATVTATTPMHLWTIRRDDFQDLLADRPGLRRELLIPNDILERLSAPRYPWLEPGELVVYHSRRHPFVFVQSMWLSTLLIGCYWALILFLARALSIGLLGFLWPAFFLYALVGLWHWINWRNDYFAVSTMRITHRERVAFLYESRNECPLGRVQNISVVTGPLGRLLNYGDLTIETAAEMGVLHFNRIPRPEAMSSAIWQQMSRDQATRRAAQRQLIREALATHLDVVVPEAPNEVAAEEARPLDHVARPQEPEVHPGKLSQIVIWLAERDLIPRTRIETDETVTWRKHWAFLLCEVAVPLLLGVVAMAVTVLGFFGFPPELVTALPFYPFLGLLVTVVMMGWLWWEYVDWGNDLYIVSNERIVDIEKRPLFFSEERREASLGMIQNVSLEIPSLVAGALNFGDVIVNTAGAGEFTFSKVPNPREVQTEIFQRMEAFREAQRRREAGRRRAELAEWFSVYDELGKSGPPQPEMSEDDSSEA